MNLGELPPRDRDAILAEGRRTRIARGDFAYTPGAPADAVYFVIEGRVKIVRTRASGSESIVGIRSPGDVFGEISATLGTALRTTSAIALEDGALARIDVATFLRLLRADAALASAFARGLARRLAAAGRELVELAGKSVPGRLVDALGRLAADHGVREPDGALRIALSLTHKDLADLIGTSRETLTKELGVLADVGLVRVSHREIVLIAPQAFPFARRRDG